MKARLLITAIAVFTFLFSVNAQNNDVSPNHQWDKVANTSYSGDFILGDVLRNHNVDSLITVATGYGVVWTGNYYVVSNFSLNMVYKITPNWSLIQSLPITGGTGLIRGMVMAKGFLWAVNVTAAIFKIDTATMTQVGQISLPGVTARALAWDIGRQGFWVSTASFAGFMRCFDTNGVAIPNSDIPAANQPGSFYGAAYDGTTAGGPYLWIASDCVPASTTQVKATRWNIATLPPTRVDSIRITIPLMVVAASGGLSYTTTLVPGKSTLLYLAQGTPDRVAVVEVADLVGINNYSNEVPDGFVLNQNYPNPFNPNTTISFGLPKTGIVKLVVTDVLGREVAVLVNEQRTAGVHTINFDASKLSSGIYFYTLTASDFKETKKMLLVK